MPKTIPSINTKRVQNILVVISIVADTSAIVAFVRTQFYLVATLAAALALLAGLLLLVRRWRQPVDVQVVLAVAVLLAGAVMLTLSLEHASRANPDPGPYPPVASSSPGPTTRTTPTPQPTLAVLFEGAVRLDSEYGTDLEKHGVVEGHQQGPVDSIDLYLTAYGLEANEHHSSLYLVVDPGDASFQTCDQKIKDSHAASTGLIFGSSMVKGSQYCFQTSTGHTAWLRINDFRLTQSPSGDYIDLSTRIWNQ